MVAQKKLKSTFFFEKIYQHLSLFEKIEKNVWGKQSLLSRQTAHFFVKSNFYDFFALFLWVLEYCKVCKLLWFKTGRLLHTIQLPILILQSNLWCRFKVIKCLTFREIVFRVGVVRLKKIKLLLHCCCYYVSIVVMYIFLCKK